MSSRPLVGVPACRRILDPHPFHVVGEKYLQALFDGADVLPVIIPSMADELDVDAVLEKLDGVLLTGSQSNVEPHHYGGDASAPGTLHDPHRDALSLPLARRALETGVPLLAICRGFQELNVALGGTLHQNVAKVDGFHDHKEDPNDPLDVQYEPSHPVNIVDGGLLHGLLRESPGESTILVNSVHGQGSCKLADGTSIEAIADDGLIEGFSVDDTPAFALAVQWHPEWKAKENEFSMKIFKAFGDACRKHAAGRQVRSE